MRPVFSFPELLETRIAPALLLLPVNSLAIPHDHGAQGTGAAGSVLLGAGDSLALDANGDGHFGPGDVKLATVSAGRALFFLTDRNTSGGWDADEITGVAVGNGIKTTIFTDVAGSITTSLDAQGNHSNVVQYAAIASLTVKGHVLGDLLAGAGVQQASLGNGEGLAVASIYVGTSADGVIEVLGPTPQTFHFEKPAGKAGASVSNVIIQGTVNSIQAGDGSDGDGSFRGGPGLPGGNIQHVTVTATEDNDLFFAAGDAGKGSGAFGGGRGGSLRGIVLRIAGNSAPFLLAGAGGNADLGRGGDGGAVDKVAFTAGGLNGELLQLQGGAGGNSNQGRAGAGGSVRMFQLAVGSGTGAVNILPGDGGVGFTGGGAGGSAAGILIDVAGLTRADVTVFAGRGGDTDSGPGGTGGSINAVTLGGELRDLAFIAGAGGFSGFGSGGNGGAVANIALLTGGTLGEVFVSGGIGGSVGGGGVRPGGRGGAGGGVRGVDLEVGGDIGDVTLLAGNGGDGEAAGGAGGSIGTQTVRCWNIGEVTVLGGGGGTSNGSTAAFAPAGGSVTQGLWVVDGDVLGDVDVHGGDAGIFSDGPASRSGNGGSLTDFIFHAEGGAKSLSFTAGAATAAVHPGDGGSIKHFAMDLGGSATAVQVLAGPGGTQSVNFGLLFPGVGGDGGALVDALVHVAGTVSGEVLIAAGSGGGAGSAGGNGGAIFGLVAVVGSTSSLLVAAGDAGGGASGGLGGMVDLAIIHADAAESFSLVGGRGGDSDKGRGGDGGGIFGAEVSLGIAAGEVHAGDGGSANFLSGGDGGSIAGSRFAFDENAVFIQAGAGGPGGFRGRTGRDGVFYFV